MHRSLTLITLIAGAAPHPLASDSVATRQKAAVAWAAKHAPVPLAFGESEDCVLLRVPSELACAKSVWACPLSSGGGSCTGSYTEETRVVFVESDARPSDEAVQAALGDARKELIVSAEAGEDTPELECTTTSGFGFGPGVSEAEKERARVEVAAREAKQHARCIAETRKRYEAQKLVYRCDVLLVNPCRREAFVRCKGRNLDGDERLTAGVSRFVW